MKNLQSMKNLFSPGIQILGEGFQLWILLEQGDIIFENHIINQN